MSVYTLNLRVFWPLFTCVLTGLVVLHHMAHRLSPEPGPEPGQEAREEDCNDQAPPVLLSLAKLILAVVACYLFIRFCSGRPGRARRGASEPADTHPKSGSSRRELLDDYYERWVRLSPHVVGHSKANVAKLVSDLVRAGRTDIAPESSLAFRGDFLQVGSSYEEHKVGSPDGFDILVPLRLPRGLRLEPRNEVELGELLLSLNYLPSAGRLNVDIIRAKQLLQTDMCQGSDPFVKVQLVPGLKLSKTKKTSCMRGTIDPFYNESFSFRVPQEDLSEVSLVFTVYGHNMKSSNDFVGRIVIGQFSTGPPETSHWRHLLASQRTAVEQWHSLRSRAECDRVSPASLEVT
ncbi:LOW QUALITY PROTEIN: inositol 1,4,5-trisphosphate receptor-interacting protein-like 2 [Osmerus eperlanus]|uniref:LOW QUALITY PROTEIN: inositol 1,4,5-trisphosphate receptor-interacting protein-like 2 n=1 Tax=Osmerus eperlanus TaxID=29151 RepID=UPI002E0D842E